RVPPFITNYTDGINLSRLVKRVCDGVSKPKSNYCWSWGDRNRQAIHSLISNPEIRLARRGKSDNQNTIILIGPHGPREGATNGKGLSGLDAPYGVFINPREFTRVNRIPIFEDHFVCYALNQDIINGNSAAVGDG